MKTKKDPFSLAVLFPLLFFCTIYPLITRVFLYDSGLEAFDWFDKTTQASDVFLYWKLVAMEAVGAAMCLILAYDLIQKKHKIKGNRLIYLLLGYALLTLLSTIFSEYNAYGWSGAYEQFEPVWCTLIYVLIVIYICFLTNSPAQIRLLIIALAIGTFVVGIIGALQFFGIDLVTSSVVQALVMPAEYSGMQLEREAFRGLTYITLYNPNYVGTYVSLLLPLFFSLSVCEKNKKLRALFVVDCALLYLLGFGCKSESGRWGVTLVLLLMLAAWFWRMPGGRRGRSALILVNAAAIIGINLYYAAGMPSPFKDAEKMARLTGDKTVMSDRALAEQQSVSENLKSIETLDDKIRVTYGESSFDLSYSNDGNEFFYNVTEEDGTFIPVTQIAEDQYLFQIADPKFDGVAFRPVYYEDEAGLGLQLIIDGKEWGFINQLNGEPGYYYYNEFGKFDKITTAECWLFENRGGFGNGRGFIWGETFPLLKQTFLFGSGADSFTLIFPQDNYVQKYLNGYETLIISRPHNMYLQLAVQNGVLALLLFLAAAAIYVFKTGKSLLNKSEWDGENGPERMGLKIGVCGGILGYLFTGLVNDAVICITPIFWCLFGIGIVLMETNILETKRARKKK